MREYFEQKNPGDPIEATFLNDLARDARYVGRSMPGSYGHQRESTRASDPNWSQNTVEITQIHDRDAGLFKCKLRFYDHSASPTAWAVYEDSGEWFLDVSDWIDPNDSQNYIERLFELDVGDRITAYWHFQRGMWVPICCPKPDDVEGSDDTGVLEHCCVSVCDTVGGSTQLTTTPEPILFDTITPDGANTFLLDPFTGEISTNIIGTHYYNISFIGGVDSGVPEGALFYVLQRDNANGNWVDISCPNPSATVVISDGNIVQQATSPVIILELIECEKIRVMVSGQLNNLGILKANASYLSICVNDCLAKPKSIGSGA